MPEARKIYESQVMIPLLVADKPYALGGPLADVKPTDERLSEFFPSYRKSRPLGQKSNPKEDGASPDTPTLTKMDLRYLQNGTRLVRVVNKLKDFDL